MRRVIRLGAAVAVAGLMTIVAIACDSTAGQDTTPEGEGSPTVDYVGEFSLTPAAGAIGSTVTAAGSGFDAGSELELAWQSFDGSWKVIDDPANFKGREYAQEMTTLATVEADDEGALEAEFTVPDGFGFLHDVLVMEDGEVRNKAGFDVEMEVSVSPESGPVGTPITVEAKGIGVRPLNQSWQLTYDNKFTGWLSAVTTNGTARATIPATGTPGTHVLKVLHGSFTFPYMNMQQSPEPDRPTFSFLFELTDGEAVLPPPAEEQAAPIVAGGPPDDVDGATVWLDTVQGPIETDVIMSGKGLPANAELDVDWLTQVGADTQIIGGSGAERPEATVSLGTVTTDGDGSLEWPFAVPEDKGGDHLIALSQDNQVVATTQFRVRPSAVAMTSTSGAAGTEITLNLKGVDDTDTGKIFMLVYDNGLVGYSCSVTSQGDITIFLPAAGEPGWHFIDLYPGIYKGEDMEWTYNFRIPQLTYADDHPGEEDVPAFRFAFKVTG